MVMSGTRGLLRLLAALAICGATFVSSCCCLGLETDDDLVLPEPAIPPVADVQVAARQVADATGTAPFAVTLDASGSTDSDGTIVRYDWDFDNDGTIDLADGGVSVPHDYDPAGTYTARVVVTDDDGLTDDDTTQLFVNPNLVPPVAAGVASQQGTSTIGNLDGDLSTDVDGTIVKYEWDFDNDDTYDFEATSPSTVHDFGAYGAFTVGLRVTDNDNLTDEADIPLTLTEPANVPPVAALTATPASGTADPQLDVVWDASASTDSDGTIVTYDWDMDNDGTFEITDGGPTQNASYTTTGLHTVGVQVTDDDGATDSTTADVDVNLPPVAALVPSSLSGVKPFGVTWDASTSTDSDGTIVTYDWDMDNDGTFEITDGGPTQSPAAYSTVGTVTVGVRVTDDDGATDQTTATVTVEGTPPIAALVGTPEQGGFVPNNVTWDASGSTDSDGTIVTYDWDMDNDGIFEITDGGPNQQFLYNTSGTKTVGVRVTDDDGLMDQTTAFVILFDIPS
jgi:PKD repeat protein